MSQKNKQTALKTVLKKYIKNEATPEEQAAVNLWYENLGTNDNSVPALADETHKNALSISIKQHLLRKVFDKKKHERQFTYLKYAAIFLLLIGVGVNSRKFFLAPAKNNHEIVFRSNDKAAKEITLKDGSKILLNVGSELTVSKEFGDSIREVSLKGEAFFAVAKDKKHPFVIRSGILKTQVLGTSFNVNAYDEMAHIKISVLTGKVKVAKNNKVLASGLTRGNVLSFNKKTETVALKIERSDYISPWRDSKLYIDNANLTEIAKQLQRYYHITVHFDTQLDTGKRYTIRFNREPANQIMEILSRLTKRKFTYQSNQITIK
ncbi:FecR family protein [Pedobacter sp. AW1-32]|uniref:FecR family protein n=1 Tax=Pedobacter sp. AW1-32 TaxID=3383026 RepID=UPI003FEE7B2F